MNKQDAQEHAAIEIIAQASPALRLDLRAALFDYDVDALARCKATLGERFKRGPLHYALHAKVAREAGEEPVFANDCYRARFHAKHG